MFYFLGYFLSSLHIFLIILESWQNQRFGSLILVIILLHIKNGLDDGCSYCYIWSTSHSKYFMLNDEDVDDFVSFPTTSVSCDDFPERQPGFQLNQTPTHSLLLRMRWEPSAKTETWWESIWCRSDMRLSVWTEAALADWESVCVLTLFKGSQARNSWELQY